MKEIDVIGAPLLTSDLTLAPVSIAPALQTPVATPAVAPLALPSPTANIAPATPLPAAEVSPVQQPVTTTTPVVIPPPVVSTQSWFSQESIVPGITNGEASLGGGLLVAAGIGIFIATRK